ncbi:hypothetical protein [Bradyrhizobium diazoefficiens]|uniref:hypothetical protein n=1 Tax=Bradyrhizobium diazoefficiens TaxID=1355477 RepID=UPI00348E0B19
MTDAIKLKVLPQFPARLIGRAGIDVTKNNGDYYLDLDYTDFPVVGSVPPGTTYALVFDPSTGKYVQMPISLLGSGGIPATAIPLVESGAGAVGVSTKYAREDHVHPAFGGGGGIAEAPNDGGLYGRQSLAWARIDGKYRERLTADRIYYVRTDGSDANNGLANTAGGAFRNPQKAIDTVASLDLSIYQATVQVGPGTYTGSLVLQPCIGAKQPNIVGDTTAPANVVLSNNNDVVSANGPLTSWRVGGFKVTNTGGHCLRATFGAFLVFEKMEFGVCAGYHISSESYSLIQGGYALFNYVISGNCNCHINSIFGGFVTLSQNTVTIANAVTVGSFAQASSVAQIRADTMTFTNPGNVTGKKYSADSNSVLYVAGGGINYFPGTVAGTLATGAQLI